jgi:hypothetical protein
MRIINQSSTQCGKGAYNNMKSRDNNKKKNFPSNIFNYEQYNISDEDSIYSPKFEERQGGQIFVSISEIRKIVNEELDKRLGHSISNRENDY